LPCPRWYPRVAFDAVHQMSIRGPDMPVTPKSRAAKRTKTAAPAAKRTTSAATARPANRAPSPPPPNQWVSLFEEGNAQMRELLGGKGAGVAEMPRAGLPVPPGFPITP